jgi:hypothetical protein
MFWNFYFVKKITKLLIMQELQKLDNKKQFGILEKF